MISFFTCLGFLVLSYFTYAKYVECVFGSTEGPTPTLRFAHGVDYVPMSLWRMVLVQLLNIAGLTPNKRDSTDEGVSKIVPYFFIALYR